MRKSLFLMAVLILGLCTAFAWAQVIHYEQNFDSLDEGDLDGQDGWAVGAPANVASPIVTADVKHGDVGKSVETSAQQEVIRVFDPMIDTGIHFLSVWFRMENPGGNTLHIYIGETTREWNAGPVVRIGTQSGDDMQVGVHNGGNIEQVAPINAGEWQHLLALLDVDNQTYTVYVDGDLAANDFSWRNPAGHTALGWLMIGFNEGAGLIGYYDDLIVGEGGKAQADAYLAALLPVDPNGKLATTWSILKQ